MAWSGGTFTRVGGVTHWVDDKNAAINIVASRHDTNDEDISTGINQCLTRDNQAKPTASFLPNADNSIDLGALATRWRNLFAVTGQFGDGLVGTPSITFSADTDTGIYRSAANQFAIAVGGAQAFRVDSTVTLLYGQVQYISDGSAGAPAFTFNSDTDTGIYRASANNLVIAANGAAVASFNASLIDFGFKVLGVADGSAGSPGLQFSSDPDTGFYRDTANQIAIGLGGVTAGQIAQGTFTLTSTGITGTPTGTAIWQRIGNHVFLFVPNIQGTSSSTALTFTGLPAILQPARTIFLPIQCLDNGVDTTTSDTGAQLNAASGTITMFKAGGTATWTAANNKGIGTSSLGGVMLCYTVA